MINRITVNKFGIGSKYEPSGDQPQAINKVVDNIEGAARRAPNSHGDWYW